MTLLYILIDKLIDFKGMSTRLKLFHAKMSGIAFVVNLYSYFLCCYVLRKNRLFGLVGRVFASGPIDLGSTPGRVIPKTFKMVLDTSLLNTKRYKVRIKGQVEQSRERSSALPYTSV